MSVDTIRMLNFKAVDDLTFAAESDRLNISEIDSPFIVEQLGPLLELYQFSITGAGLSSLRGSWLNVNVFSGLGKAISAEKPYWVSPEGNPLGILKTVNQATERDWILFAIQAKRAAIEAGLSVEWATQMVGAIGEFRSNIIEHSRAQDTGLIAFRGSPGTFEFVAVDRGVGLLATLRGAAECNRMNDHAEALRLALTDGVSRFGFNQGRGFGFQPLFMGLASRHAFLRFRTGNASLVIDGTTPLLSRAQLGQKARIGGLFISVRCQTSMPSS